jgi:Plavaka transposase
MYCPLILGSDKTTVSVAMGHVEYHPLYLSIGNPHNKVRCVHHNAVIPIAFLAIPKGMSYFTSTKEGSSRYVHDDLGDRRYDNDPEFRKFKRQLYHVSISAILQTLQPGMMNPVIRRCLDGHYRWVIYDLVAFIADYPEQVMLTGIVQGWCPR